MLTPHHRTVKLAKSPTTASTSVTSDSRRLSARGLPPLRTTPLVEHTVALAAACFHGHPAVTFSAALRRPLPTAVNINAPTFRLTRQHLDPTPLGVFVVLCSTHTTRTSTARPPLQPHVHCVRHSPNPCRNTRSPTNASHTLHLFRGGVVSLAAARYARCSDASITARKSTQFSFLVVLRPFHTLRFLWSGRLESSEAWNARGAFDRRKCFDGTFENCRDR